MSRTEALPDLARKLSARRDELMLSQAEAAAQIGISRRLYQALEYGDVRRSHPRTRRRIEAWLTGAA